MIMHDKPMAYKSTNLSTYPAYIRLAPVQWIQTPYGRIRVKIWCVCYDILSCDIPTLAPETVYLLRVSMYIGRYILLYEMSMSTYRYNENVNLARLYLNSLTTAMATTTAVWMGFNERCIMRSKFTTRWKISR